MRVGNGNEKQAGDPKRLRERSRRGGACEEGIWRLLRVMKEEKKSQESIKVRRDMETWEDPNGMESGRTRRGSLAEPARGIHLLKLGQNVGGGRGKAKRDAP